MSCTKHNNDYVVCPFCAHEQQDANMVDGVTVGFANSVYTLFLLLTMLIPGKAHRWAKHKFNNAR